MGRGVISLSCRLYYMSVFFYVKNHQLQILNSLLSFSQQESVMSTTSLDSKLGSRRRSRAESRIEGLSGSVPQMMYASSFDLSNTFARNDYFSDINPRSMRRLMNIVSVTGKQVKLFLIWLCNVYISHWIWLLIYRQYLFQKVLFVPNYFFNFTRQPNHRSLRATIAL